jgi:N-methylhydantoinase A/oxoprolinase/acetone carboxylase beta subunit
MVVRGDGSLVSSSFVRERPIETILSGPAASLVGAAHLTGAHNAIIADIGGTTTDIAVLRDGVPTISQDGASVGGHRTMVSAVDMFTHGLGGDSHVRHDPRAAGASLHIGPRRVLPLCQLATREATFVHDTLQRQLRSLPSELDGMIVVIDDPDRITTALSPNESDVIAQMPKGIAAVDTLARSMTTRRIIDRLVRRRVLTLSAFTPTDASHVIGLQSTFDSRAARAGAELLARQRDRLGRAIETDATAIAQLTIDRLVRLSAEAVLGAAFARDGLPDDTVNSAIVQRAIDRRSTATGAAASPAVTVQLGLAVPLIALGASASAYYPRVAEALGARAMVPEHAGVANAIGAVVGRVRITHQCIVSAPQQGQYIVHGGHAPALFVEHDQAVAYATETLQRLLDDEMTAAGATAFETSSTWTEQTVEVSGIEMFVEGTLTMTASGRPDVGPR